MKCRSNFRQNVCRSLICLAIIISILSFVPSKVDAQLKPWDHTNQVFVDLSVINDTTDLRQISPYARINPLIIRKGLNTRTSSLSGFNGQLLEPPDQKPVSRFLLRNSTGAAKDRHIPNSKLL